MTLPVTFSEAEKKEDLNSKNGTRINGKHLKAGAFYEVRDKDELQPDRLKLCVTFSNQPASALATPPIQQLQSKEASVDDTVFDIRNIDSAADV